MQDTIHEYIKERRRISGVLLATVVGNEIRIGWSKTNFRAGDEFDKTEGIRIATARAKGEEATPSLPPQLKDQMREFQIRALRYFKQGLFPATPATPVPVSQAQNEMDDIMAMMQSFLSPTDRTAAQRFFRDAGVIFGRGR